MVTRRSGRTFRTGRAQAKFLGASRGFQGHVILLKENGIYILETMNTGPLVRDRAFEFLFVLGQARLRGAVQMIINPIAIR